MSLLSRSLCVVACVVAVCATPPRNFAIQSRLTGPNSDATSTNQFPHQVSIRFQRELLQPKSHICGGSIIGADWVLTAAHCLCNEYINQILAELDGLVSPLLPTTPLFRSVICLVCTLLDPPKLTVVAGTIYLSTGGTPISVEEVIQHPDYDSKRIINDVGLIRLKSSTTFTPIPLSGVAASNKTFTISGWGLESGTATTLPDRLQYAELNQLDTATCNAILTAAISDASVTYKNVCTEDETSTCSGDSGGALIADTVLSTGATVVAQQGIVSWGVATSVSVCDNDFPSVFTNVTAFCGFIFDKTQIRCVK